MAGLRAAIELANKAMFYSYKSDSEESSTEYAQGVLLLH